ncbi:acetate/propionate family kinase [Rubellimicrobium aerolatum]|uniref:Acetate kinase n=1 Tax=Rubellimicrobium aerolatum TaxID=490979 RepID=A0ABW0S9N5_9RHOB|nr:acetate kinase [Rubellimicrobium aerolatum]MBP1804987.1 acetate kinase [Rubellimicrobium aerolatum]
MILVVNAGSSSVKVALFTPTLREVLRGSVTEIGATGELTLGPARQPVRATDHGAALAYLLAMLAASGHPAQNLTAAAHRVVHGGATLTAPRFLDDATLAEIEACVPLAPLHNPANLQGIRALQRLAPDLPQVASFDTAFHSTVPPVESTYALPAPLRDGGLRRYGFHGLSYAALASHLRDRNELPRRLLAFHLGNGASACALLDGASVATTMGYSPLDGLVMGTRTGSIDGMAVLAIARTQGIEATETLLNRASGLKALAGTSDMRTLLARDDAEARFAIDHFCHWAIRQGAGLAAALGGLDALAFTGGIGENATPIRTRIAQGLAFLNPQAPTHVVPAQEERQIAADASALLPLPS